MSAALNGDDELLSTVNRLFDLDQSAPKIQMVGQLKSESYKT
jgi:hypothetical protein